MRLRTRSCVDTDACGHLSYVGVSIITLTITRDVKFLQPSLTITVIFHDRADGGAIRLVIECSPAPNYEICIEAAILPIATFRCSAATDEEAHGTLTHCPADPCSHDDETANVLSTTRI